MPFALIILLVITDARWTKITGTIASVRRNRLLSDDIDEEIDSRVHNSRENRGKSVCFSYLVIRSRHSWPTAGNESSFIAETSFVRAPLNSRVGTTNSTPKSKGKEREDILDHLPVDIQEAIVLEDLLYVLMVSNEFRQ